jgi:hypothetical protein
LPLPPSPTSLAFTVVGAGDDEYVAIFARGRGFLTYWLPPGDVVVLLRLVWVS